MTATVPNTIDKPTSVQVGRNSGAKAAPKAKKAKRKVETSEE